MSSRKMTVLPFESDATEITMAMIADAASRDIPATARKTFSLCLLEVAVLPESLIIRSFRALKRAHFLAEKLAHGHFLPHDYNISPFERKANESCRTKRDKQTIRMKRSDFCILCKGGLIADERSECGMVDFK